MAFGRDNPFWEDSRRWVAELRAEVERASPFDRSALGALEAFCEEELRAMRRGRSNVGHRSDGTGEGHELAVRQG
jgi:hypothetical protein